jgi:hypothetical protein
MPTVVIALPAEAGVVVALPAEAGQPWHRRRVRDITILILFVVASRS